MTLDTAPTPEDSVDAPESADEPDRGDLPGGMIVVAVGVAILFYVRDFPTLPSGELGPALFPGIIGGLMVLLGAILVARWIKNRKKDPTSTKEPAIVHWRGWVNAGFILGAIIFYLLAADFLGFLTTVIVMNSLLMYRLGAKAWMAIVAGIVSAVAIWLIFSKVLLVPLPLGFWS